MSKTFVGPQLRQLRRSQDQTQAEMARALGVSPGYVNLLENNQRSLSVRLLAAIADAYDVDWRDLVSDEAGRLLGDLRTALKDPMFADRAPDLPELRAAIDHAPRLVSQFLRLYGTHRTTLERVMRQGAASGQDGFLHASPEAEVHDFFRDRSNYFDELEQAADRLRAAHPCGADDHYAALKAELARHNVTVERSTMEALGDVLRQFDRDAGVVYLSEALDHQNRVFQLAHVVGLLIAAGALDRLTNATRFSNATAEARCRVELANYFAAAYLMPYEAFLETARETRYDIDRLAARFAVSVEQASQRLTTLQRPGREGVPFFFLRVDKAGNVSKRFNATSFHLAEYGGACPVWNIHMTFRTPGTILPQFVELPDGERFFTFSRTAERPVFNRNSQEVRLAIALGCELRYANEVTYAATFNPRDDDLYSPIGINCYLCPRTSCSQRAHQPAFMDLPISPDRRGNTRHES